MRNGYFRLISDSEGYGLALFRPRGGGEEIRPDELFEYLDGHGISYVKKKIEMLLGKSEDVACMLGSGKCPSIPETYTLKISEDGMVATVRFLPPSATGKRAAIEDLMQELRYKKICFGIKTDYIKKHFGSSGIFCTDLILAKGQEPVAGVDARIEYNFETDLHRKPARRQDGSVDFFQMTKINQCRKGDVLARIIPEQPGTNGHDIYGREIKAKAPQPAVLRFERNIVLSADKKSIIAGVNGHVSLVEDRVFLSDIYEVQNVDVSTGNISYEGSVRVNGDVAENYEIKAGGDVLVNGRVEGAKIVAKGNIIVAKGVNGMGKGLLQAGGDVAAKFLENANVVAKGYVQAEAILHSMVMSGSEVTVEGRKGLIVGGNVQAVKKITAKNVGASMGSNTVLQVGVDPQARGRYDELRKAIEDAEKTVKNAETILFNFREKLKKGITFNEGQLQYVNSLSGMAEGKKAELAELNTRLEELEEEMKFRENAEVIVNDAIYPGTTIMIGDISRTFQGSYHYCRFIREKGEVCMAPL